MIRSSLSSWSAVCLAAALSFSGCTSGSTSGDTGSLDLTLELADGIVINQVAWTITGEGMDPMTGTINTSAPGSTASLEVAMPAGEDFTIVMEATDESGEVMCRGDAEFDIVAGATNEIMVFLKCTKPSTLGGVRVNGKFNICAQLTKVIVSPLQTSIGNDIDLSASAEDVEEDPISYEWTATGGTIADSSAPITTFTCGEVGEQSITITVSDDDFDHCTDSWTVAVTCVDGGGGTGGAGGGAGGAGGEGGGAGGAGGAGGGTGGAGGGTGGAGGAGGGTGGAGGGMGGAGGSPDLCEGVVCDDTECSDGVCNPETGECIDNPINEGEACDSDTGTCTDGMCVDNCAGVVCDPIECNDNACNPFTGQCEATPVDDGDPCADGTGVCMEGSCEITVEVVYSEDFESLDQASPTALGDAGFTVFGNEFLPDGTPIQGYGPFPAPNNSGGFSGIALDQGGATQGLQQLVIFSDYNNTVNQEAGNLVEANTFQEQIIPAEWVGRTLTFSFDAKRGNINDPNDPACPCSSEAIGFIKVLDSVGFFLTRFISEDTTNLPDDWGRYEIVLEVTDDLAGQILQVGFAATATLFQPSAVFYDNLLVTLTSGDNGGGGEGELTNNGDFETGDTTGWQSFAAENNGTFEATSAESNGGMFSGNLVASVPPEGGFASFPVVKQANIGIGAVAPGDTINISFDLFGSLAGAGGVVFAEFFSELDGGGTSKAEILSGGPLFPNPPNDWTAGWVTYTFTTTAGPDVSGGVTLQLKADCGANAGCTVNTYFDNVSVTLP